MTERCFHTTGMKLRVLSARQIPSCSIRKTLTLSQKWYKLNRRRDTHLNETFFSSEIFSTGVSVNAEGAFVLKSSVEPLKLSSAVRRYKASEVSHRALNCCK